jgi:hypothetical protein
VQTANQGGVGSNAAGRAVGVVHGSPNTWPPCAKALVTGADHRSFFVAAGCALFIAMNSPPLPNLGAQRRTRIEFIDPWMEGPITDPKPTATNGRYGGTTIHLPIYGQIQILLVGCFIPASFQRGMSRSVQQRRHSAALVRVSIGFMALPCNQLGLRRDARNQLIQPS